MATVDYERGLIDDAPLAGPGQQLLSTWSSRRQAALNDRRQYEPTWSMCEHFAAGRHWVMWARGGRAAGRVVTEPNPQQRERHTVNVITQYLLTMLGKLFVEDLRPTIVFTRPDAESENMTTHTRAVARYLWDSEIGADALIYDMLHSMLTYGTAAMRCYFDTERGQEIGQFPVGPDGQPIVDPQAARAYVMQAAQTGQQVPFMPLREGKITWESLSPRSLLLPAGVVREHNFPWVMIERPMSIDMINMKYPQSTGVVREQDLTSHEVTAYSDTVEQDAGSPAQGGKLKGHALVTTGFEMPTPEFPNGRTVVYVDSQKVVLDVKDTLPYKLRGEPHHGIVFFHYHRLAHRFLSMGVVEDLIGPQRQKNRARSQMIEMKDRNLGRIYAKKGTITVSNKPVGKMMELIEIPLHADFPVETQGVPPGPWIENEARINDEDMDRVAGLREVSMGTQPSGVSAYAALALLAEQDERRVGPVLKMLRIGLGDLLVLSLEMARTYWQNGKHIAVAGVDGELERYAFERAMLPLEFYVDVSRHSPLPTSPAVEAQKIFDLFNAATSAGQPLPVEWLKSSLDQGRALPIPKREEQVQIGKAEMENSLMAQGQMGMPAYYDDDYIHIQVHRQAQQEMLGNPQMAQIFEMHIQMHVQNATMKKPTSQDSVPQMQGGHGIEAQNSPHANMQGAAQTASGEAPMMMPGTGQE